MLTVQRQQSLLGFDLRRDEAHRSARCGLADRLCADEVVLVTFDEGPCYVPLYLGSSGGVYLGIK
jgi:hypothetical protein